MSVTDVSISVRPLSARKFPASDELLASPFSGHIQQNDAKKNVKPKELYILGRKKKAAHKESNDPSLHSPGDIVQKRGVESYSYPPDPLERAICFP
jgi:hypothetical protein